MKKVVLTLLIAVSFLVGRAQIYNSGGSITVANNALLVIEGDYTSSGGGTIDNDGIVNLKGHFINNGGSMDLNSTGSLNFVGTTAQEIKGSESFTFYGTVNINNTNGVTLTSVDETINGTLQFTAGKLTIGAFDLTLANNASGAGAANYVVTNGTGLVFRTVAATDVPYPIGNTAYNPLVLNNAGTSDVYGVKVNDGVPAGWTPGLNHVINRYWTVTEAVAGESSLSVTPQWNSTEEQTGFDRTDAAVGLTNDDGATVAWMASGASTGSDPYSRSGAGFTGVGTYMVGDYFYEGLELNVNLILSGAYNASLNKMRTDLYTANLIPLTDPYSLSTTVTTIPSGVVDWVRIELRDKNDHSIPLYSRAYFVDQDGNLLNIDGQLGAKLREIGKDQYYVAVKHRNHLTVVSDSQIDLSPGSATYSFTSAQAQAYQNPTYIGINNALRQIDSSPITFGLWNGDANNNGIIRYNGSNNDKNSILLEVGLGDPNNILYRYSKNDVNLDGIIRYNGTNNDKNSILSVVGLLDPNFIIYQHLQ